MEQRSCNSDCQCTINESTCQCKDESKNKPAKRIKHGFSMTIMNIKLTVFFEYFNEKVIKCHLIDGDEEAEDFYVKEFIGTAKLHSNDAYDRNFGEELSLMRARDKYMSFKDNEIRRLLDYKKRLLNEVDAKLVSKLNNIQNK